MHNSKRWLAFASNTVTQICNTSFICISTYANKAATGQPL